MRIAIVDDTRQDREALADLVNSCSRRMGLPCDVYLFTDGEAFLETADPGLLRSEKLPLLLESEEVLRAISFCGDWEKRPENCGLCGRCLATKLMFLATTGQVPEIFMDGSVPDDWLDRFDLHNNYHFSEVLDIVMSFKLHNKIHLLPYGEEIFAAIKKFPISDSGRIVPQKIVL